MSEKLTKKTAYEALRKFFEDKPFAIFGTGTSCAVHPDYGMFALSRHLSEKIPQQEMTTEQKMQWGSVMSALDEGKDLESAMDVIKDESLIRWIVNCTADMVISLDREHCRKIMLSQTVWPALPLFKCLMKLLINDRILHVATPNYDLLAEYALEHAEIPYLTGFVGGVCRRLDWSQAERGMTFGEKIHQGKKALYVTKQKPHIRLYKVHGSLNTFKYNNTTVENNAWMFEVPDGIERVMITPGMMKYERLHENRSDLLNSYDTELAKHNAFLFIGFGFNDNQLINDSLKRKLIDQKSPALVITRDSNDRIENLACKCENLWVVCFQEKDDCMGTRIFNNCKGEIFLPNTSIWDSGEFARKILGG